MLQRSPRVIAALFLTLALAACAENPYRTPDHQEVKGDGMSVVITHARNEAEARPLADHYCRAQGAGARFTGMVQYHTKRETSKGASFDCYGPTA